jgi:hypothetical protein
MKLVFLTKFTVNLNVAILMTLKLLHPSVSRT